MTTPYRVVTPQLALRCFTPADAPELRDVVARSREHLAPWVPLPPEGETLEEMVARLRQLRALFDTDQELNYAGILRETSELVAVAHLQRDTAPHARRLGAWVRPDHTRRGLAFECGAALTRVGFELLKCERLEVRTDPGNAPVIKVADRLGYRRDGLVRGLEWIDGAPRDQEVWTMLAADYPGSGAARLAVQSFDALDRRLL